MFQYRNVRHPPLRFGVLMGEIVHNMRSSLDHLACQPTRPAQQEKPDEGTLSRSSTSSFLRAIPEITEKVGLRTPMPDCKESSAATEAIIRGSAALQAPAPSQYHPLLALNGALTTFDSSDARIPDL